MTAGDHIEVKENIGPKLAVKAVAIGLSSGLLVVLAPYALVALYASLTHQNAGQSLTAFSGFNFALIVVFPLVQGFAMALALGPKRRSPGQVTFLALVLTAVELFAGAVILREGVICLVMAAPIVAALVILGAGIGRILVRRRRDASLYASLIPLIVLGVFAEAAGPRPDFAASIEDAVVVNAPPEYVWRYVVQYPENRSPPDYWLWRIGLPYPSQSLAQAPQVGGRRLCRFNTGVAFEERITELEPNRVLTFAVTHQPDDPEITGHFRFDRGQIRLVGNGDGTTTIIATSWYRLFVRPAAYFDWWTSDITRHVHTRVLNHMKALAEADYRAERVQ